MKYKILNLYACLGGNRYKWDEVADIEVTAVELDPELARMYQERFPNDVVIIADAHQYLLDHYKEFDFIWTSPPCPSHSKAAFGSRKSDKSNHKPVFPDFFQICQLPNRYLQRAAVAVRGTIWAYQAQSDSACRYFLLYFPVYVLYHW